MFLSNVQSKNKLHVNVNKEPFCLFLTREVTIKSYFKNTCVKVLGQLSVEFIAFNQFLHNSIILFVINSNVKHHQTCIYIW